MVPLKESNQMNVMNLEIDDYLKTIESLNDKLQAKVAECLQLKNDEESTKEKLKTSAEESGMSFNVYFALQSASFRMFFN